MYDILPSLVLTLCMLCLQLSMGIGQSKAVNDLVSMGVW